MFDFVVECHRCTAVLMNCADVRRSLEKQDKHFPGVDTMTRTMMAFVLLVLLILNNLRQEVVEEVGQPENGN